MEEALARMEGLLEELLAILLLEYHNKNHLTFGANPKRLNEEQREIVNSILWEVEELRSYARSRAPQGTWHEGEAEVGEAETSERSGDAHPPASQKGRFICTRERNHFTLIFNNGDMM